MTTKKKKAAGKKPAARKAPAKAKKAAAPNKKAGSQARLKAAARNFPDNPPVRPFPDPKKPKPRSSRRSGGT